MLNPFPIQFLALFAYFILRLCVGALLVHLGLRHLQNQKAIIASTRWPLLLNQSFPITVLIVAELIFGIMFIAGWYTQYAALATLVLCFTMIVSRHRFTHPAIPERMFYVLLGAAALSLFITGAGVFAFDLPI